jgi:hypothetical protein
MDSSPPPPPEPPPQKPAFEPAVKEHVQGLQLDVSGDEELDKKLATIEMAGEESAAGFSPARHRPLSPDVRYLHISRTIHELITDRNRSVGIFLFVASVMFAASTALLNAKPVGRLIVPLELLQYWCLPITFGTLGVLGMFISLILIRARIGLIYEVTKMNTLLGLPSERVRRVNPLSIFYLMHTVVTLLGAACSGLAAAMLAYHSSVGSLPKPSAGTLPGLNGMADLPGQPDATLPIALGLGITVAYLVLLEALYFILVVRATSDSKLQEVGKR